MSFTINEKLRQIIPPMGILERRDLEKSLLLDGCRDALIVWREENALLDGHNRYEICTKHNLPYQTIELSLPDMDAAKVWMIDNQLSRRNLGELQIRLLRGKRLNLEKKPIGAPTGNNNAEKQLAQNEPIESANSTADKLAAKYHVSRETMKRDGQYATAVEAIAKAAQMAPTQVVAQTEGRLGRQEIQELAAVSEQHPEQAIAVLDAVKDVEQPKEAKAVMRQTLDGAGDVSPAAPDPGAWNQHAWTPEKQRQQEEKSRQCTVERIFQTHTREQVESLIVGLQVWMQDKDLRSLTHSKANLKDIKPLLTALQRELKSVSAATA